MKQKADLKQKERTEDLKDGKTDQVSNDRSIQRTQKVNMMASKYDTFNRYRETSKLEEKQRLAEERRRLDMRVM